MGLYLETSDGHIGGTRKQLIRPNWPASYSVGDAILGLGPCIYISNKHCMLVCVSHSWYDGDEVVSPQSHRV